VLALELGLRRAGTVVGVFTSDLRRAVQTAEIAFNGSGLAVQQDWRLRECNYGVLNGMRVQELEQGRHAHVDEPYEGGESYRDVVERVQGFLDDLAAEQEGNSVVVIGHAATRWALDHLLHGIPLEQLVDAPFEWQEGWCYSLLGG
jgi:2,3-bisphosphoglycerate-dependent phosphoglycerate mutase